MSVTNIVSTPVSTPIVARQPHMDDVLAAFEIDEAPGHFGSPGHADFASDGEALYLDLEGFFDLDDDLQLPARAVSAQKIS